MQVRFTVFKATFKTWEDMCQEAADFATSVGQKNLIGISHSDNGGTGVITVWYWR